MIASCIGDCAEIAPGSKVIGRSEAEVLRVVFRLDNNIAIGDGSIEFPRRRHGEPRGHAIRSSEYAVCYASFRRNTAIGTSPSPARNIVDPASGTDDDVAVT
jgi:hypothetical protein